MKQRRRSTNKRQTRRNTGRRGNSLARMSYVRSNPSEQLITLTFPLKTFKISLAATSTFNFSIECDTLSTILDSDHTTICQKFSGYRVTKVACHMIPLSTTAGSSVFFFSDTENTNAGTSFRSYRHATYPNTNAASTGYHMSWSPKDFQSLDFNDSNTTTAKTLFNFYGYSNLTDLGTPSSTVDLWSITGTITVQLRGLSV